MSKKIVLIGAFLVLLSIVLGAMAAHALEKVISANLIETFEKGVKYELYAGIGLLVVGLNADRLKFSLKAFLWLNLIGVVLFSWGIFLYSIHEIFPGLHPMAMIVPFGGISFIAAWAVFMLQIIRNHRG